MSHEINIGFSFKDEFGHVYTQNSSVEVFTELGDNDITVIGRQLNCFLKQCGFYRPNDYILMDSITEDEAEILSDYLIDLRSNDK